MFCYDDNDTKIGNNEYEFVSLLPKLAARLVSKLVIFSIAQPHINYTCLQYLSMLRGVIMTLLNFVDLAILSEIDQSFLQDMDSEQFSHMFSCFHTLCMQVGFPIYLFYLFIYLFI